MNIFYETQKSLIKLQKNKFLAKCKKNTELSIYAETLPHVMEFTRVRVLEAMFALVRKGIFRLMCVFYNFKIF